MKTSLISALCCATTLASSPFSIQIPKKDAERDVTDSNISLLESQDMPSVVFSPSGMLLQEHYEDHVMSAHEIHQKICRLSNENDLIALKHVLEYAMAQRPRNLNWYIFLGLQEAIANGHQDIIIELLVKADQLGNIRNCLFRGIVIAARHCQLDVLRLLLQSALMEFKFTAQEMKQCIGDALSVAVIRDCKEMVKLVMTSVIEMGLCFRDLKTAIGHSLIAAAEACNDFLVEYLLSQVSHLKASPTEIFIALTELIKRCVDQESVLLVPRLMTSIDKLNVCPSEHKLHLAASIISSASRLAQSIRCKDASAVILLIKEAQKLGSEWSDFRGSICRLLVSSLDHTRPFQSVNETVRFIASIKSSEFHQNIMHCMLQTVVLGSRRKLEETTIFLFLNSILLGASLSDDSMKSTIRQTVYEASANGSIFIVESVLNASVEQLNATWTDLSETISEGLVVASEYQHVHVVEWLKRFATEDLHVDLLDLQIAIIRGLDRAVKCSHVTVIEQLLKLVASCLVSLETIQSIVVDGVSTAIADNNYAMLICLLEGVADHWKCSRDWLLKSVITPSIMRAARLGHLESLVILCISSVKISDDEDYFMRIIQQDPSVDLQIREALDLQKTWIEGLVRLVQMIKGRVGSSVVQIVVDDIIERDDMNQLLTLIAAAKSSRYIPTIMQQSFGQRNVEQLTMADFVRLYPWAANDGNNVVLEAVIRWMIDRADGKYGDLIKKIPTLAARMLKQAERMQRGI